MTTAGFSQIGINLLSVTGSTLPSLIKDMSQNGDETTFNANGDYSGALTEFIAAPSEDEVWAISTLRIQIVDAGTMDSGSYGNGITLTNGIRVIQTFDPDASPAADGQINFTPNFPVIDNGDWSRYTGNFTLANYGSGAEYLSWDYHLPQIVRLIGKKRQRLGVLLNDSFTGLIRQTFTVLGAIQQGGPNIG